MYKTRRVFASVRSFKIWVWVIIIIIVVIVPGGKQSPILLRSLRTIHNLRILTQFGGFTIFLANKSCQKNGKSSKIVKDIYSKYNAYFRMLFENVLHEC